MKKLKQQKRPDRKKDALRRLGVSSLDLQASADISSLLKMAEGGLKGTLAAMRFSRELNIIAFLEKYDSISERDRKSLSWEAICLAAEVQPTTLLGCAILAIQHYSASAVKIIALSSHPEVMRKRVEFAGMPSGGRDRDAIQQGLGFLPTSKGSTFIINPGTKPEVREGDDDDDEPDDERSSDLDHLFPSLSKTQDTLVPLKARMLEAGS